MLIPEVPGTQSHQRDRYTDLPGRDWSPHHGGQDREVCVCGGGGELPRPGATHIMVASLLSDCWTFSPDIRWSLNCHWYSHWWRWEYCCCFVVDVSVVGVGVNFCYYNWWRFYSALLSSSTLLLLCCFCSINTLLKSFLFLSQVSLRSGCSCCCLCFPWWCARQNNRPAPRKDKPLRFHTHDAKSLEFMVFAVNAL